jgi:hypothetical protein
MTKITKLELEIIFELLDGCGYSGTELATNLNKNKGNISGNLKTLKSEKHILYSNPRKMTNRDQYEHPYFISMELSVFDNIFKCLVDNKQGEQLIRFLNSKYTNNIIKKFGFLSVYEIVEENLQLVEFRKLASEPLLNQPATIDEYNNISNIIQKCLLEGECDPPSFDYTQRPDKTVPIWNLYSEYIGDSSIIKIDAQNNILYFKRLHIKEPLMKHIEILTKFDPIVAVNHYRDTVLEEIHFVLSELSQKAHISNLLWIFIESDVYLSPFTSYPINSPQFLLFSKPFQRIFDDVYLLDKLDRIDFEVRASKIFNNFVDVLYEFFKFNMPSDEKMLEQQIKQFIFQWNIASSNFDFIDYYMDMIYGMEMGSGMYHLRGDGLKLQIIDLETNKPPKSKGRLPEPHEKYDIHCCAIPMDFDPRNNESGARYMKNPFTELRPCGSCSAGNISFEQILSGLTSKLDDHEVVPMGR